MVSNCLLFQYFTFVPFENPVKRAATVNLVSMNLKRKVKVSYQIEMIPFEPNVSDTDLSRLGRLVFLRLWGCPRTGCQVFLLVRH